MSWPAVHIAWYRQSQSMRCYATPAAWLVLSTLFLVACSSDRQLREDAVTRGNRAKILHMGIGAEPQALDPHIVTGVTESRIIHSLLEGLVGKDPASLDAIPGVANSWNIADNKTTYTFNFREDAKWSNGDTVRAQDFVFSWRRLLSPALAAEYAYNLYVVKNARDYHRGTLKDFDKVGVRAIDDRTLEVRLEHPAPYFLQLLDHTSALPVHPATIEGHGATLRRDTDWTRPKSYVGNGPFQLETWQIGEGIFVRKNRYYWDYDGVQLNGIQFYPVENQNTEENMFRSGQLHITSGVAIPYVPLYLEKRPDLIRISPYLGTYYYELNVSKPPLDDLRVRRALMLATDRYSITAAITQAGQRPAYSFTPPLLSGYRPPSDRSLAYNPKRARRLLAEAGYPGGLDFPVLQLLYNTSDDHRTLAVAIQEMWQKNLGIKVELNNQEWKVYLNTRNNLEHQIARAGWVADFEDPSNFLEVLSGDSGNNRSAWSNPEYDHLVARAKRTWDSEKRNELFARAERLMISQAPIIPIYHYASKRLLRRSVVGWSRNALDHQRYQELHLLDNPSRQEPKESPQAGAAPAQVLPQPGATR